MEKNSLEGKGGIPVRITNYKGHNVYTWNAVPKEVVATVAPNTIGIPSAITFNLEAYQILKARPDFLTRIYDHELEHDEAQKLSKPDLHPKHGLDNDILEFLKYHGYDFGDFKF